MTPSGNRLTTSVALCTCNGAGHLDEQLDSIAQGTVLPDEIVVCDDRSDDDTVAIVERFAAKSTFPVTIHRNEERLGSTRNFEQAIRLCRHDIIFLCDQDDVWYSDRIERSLQAFVDPQVGGVFTDADLVDRELRPLNKKMFAYLGIRHFIEKNADDFFGRLLFKPFVTGATMAFRRALTECIRPYPTSRFFIHDGWLALTIAGMARLVVIDKSLIQYRQHAGQQVGTMLSGIQQSPAITRRIIRYPLNRHEFVQFYDELAALLAPLPLRAEAHTQFGEAVAHNNHRLAMGHLRVLRPWAIMREVMTGRYHIFSTGWQSAAKDLLHPQ